MTFTVAELKCLQGLLVELEIKDNKPCMLYYDNQVANLVYHERTKHIEIDCHFVRESIQKGLMQTKHIPKKKQLVYILTKGLRLQHHQHLVSKLGAINIYHPLA